MNPNEWALKYGVDQEELSRIRIILNIFGAQITAVFDYPLEVWKK